MKNKYAIVTLMLGICSVLMPLLFVFFGSLLPIFIYIKILPPLLWILPISGLVCGVMSIVQIRKRGETGTGSAVTGLVLSVLVLGAYGLLIYMMLPVLREVENFFF